MTTSFTVKIPKLPAAIAGTAPGAFRQSLGEATETYIDDASLSFRDTLRLRTPVRHGRGSQWERAKHKGPGAMRRSVNRTMKRAGIDSTARIRVGDRFGVIVEGGSAPHVIKAHNGKSLFVGGRFVSEVHHPGSRPNPFFHRALGTVDGIVGPLAKKAGFATADKMAARIARGR